MIQHRISQFIDKEGLFSLKEKVLVAVSGGADSVALLRILLSIGYTCEAAHCNFHLRGEESNRDEAFVRDLCRRLNIPLHVTHFDTMRHATEQRISIEMAARELRYRWFAELKKEIDASVIAIGHHQEDSIETMLLNLIRGTGIHGLTGIRPRNGDVVRPLLCVSREEIVTYLNRANQGFVTDSTNLEDEFTRNKIRLNLMPLMQEINPSIKASLLETIHHLQSTSLVYKKGIEEGKERVFSPTEGINLSALLSEASPEALLFEILHPLGFNSSQIKDITSSLTRQAGKEFISKEWRVIKDREWLLIEKPKAVGDAAPIPHLVKEKYDYSPDFVIPREKNTACFDADKLNDEITIRQWKVGDSFTPFGMTGRKMVSDYLTDRKFSISRKENQWLLCCGNRIAWLIGERTDNRFRVDEQTKRVVIYRIQNQSEY